MNYVENDFVIDELNNIHRKKYDIEINWFSGKFKPKQLSSARIEKSIKFWRSWLEDHLDSHNVEFERLSSLNFVWPSGQGKFMAAVDDRGKEYKT
jgi:hypothetical protein